MSETKYKCEVCKDTGYYGDNGAGIRGNREYQPCDMPIHHPSPSPTAEQKRPKIVCLCGSTRFTEQMLIKQWELTKQGCIVVTWCALPDSYFQTEDKAHIGDKEGVKEFVDEVHKRKIDLCDEVLVLNIGGYIGESTRSEIEYAKAHNKPVKYIEEIQ